MNISKHVKDISGQRFGRLIVKRFHSKKPDSSLSALWECLCDCGKICIVKSGHLTQGGTRSCGCLRRELNKRSKPCFRRGQLSNLFRHGMSRSRTYVSWQAMRKRCTDTTRKNFKNYAHIKVCKQWNKSFIAFFKDMGERPLGKTLDRWPDKNGNYEPGNCRWATWIEQARNRNKRKSQGAQHGPQTIL